MLEESSGTWRRMTGGSAGWSGRRVPSSSQWGHWLVAT